MRNNWTVIGLYPDGLTYAAHFTAPTAETAIATAALAGTVSDNPPLEILGAVKGHVEFFPACGDSFKSAMECDLAELYTDGTGTRSEWGDLSHVLPDFAAKK